MGKKNSSGNRDELLGICLNTCKKQAARSSVSGTCIKGLSGKLGTEETGVAEESSVCSLSYDSLKGPQGHFFWRYSFLGKKR